MGDAPTPADVVAAWDELAAFWDERSGPAGSELHQLLLAPSLHRLLGVTAGESILDVGCGNGVVSRELARAGADVVGCDASAVFVDIARRHSEGLSIDYHVVDATDEQRLVALGPERFDGIVASMVLMDLPDVEPLLRAAARLLRAGGRLVCSVLHPCFNNPSTVWLIEERRDLTRVHSVKITDYRDRVDEYRASGEPAPHWFFHRSMSTLVSAAAEAGFVVDGLEEPMLAPDTATTSAWAPWGNIPPVLVIRFRQPPAVPERRTVRPSRRVG